MITRVHPDEGDPAAILNFAFAQRSLAEQAMVRYNDKPKSYAYTSAQVSSMAWTNLIVHLTRTNAISEDGWYYDPRVQTHYWSDNYGWIKNGEYHADAELNRLVEL